MSQAGLAGVMDVIGAGRADPAGPALPWSTLTGLLALIPCDCITWCELDLTVPQRVVQQSVYQDGARDVVYGSEEPWVFDLLRRFRGCNKEPVPDVFRWSDLYTDRALARQPAFAEVFRGEVTRQLQASFPALPGRTRRLMLRRLDGPDFTAGDVTLIEILRPHLLEAYQLAQRRHVLSSMLTSRESEVLDLVAGGLRNDEIAELLVISVATVRKHLEHIFDRTGLRSRAAVVARLIHQSEPMMLPEGDSDCAQVYYLGQFADRRPRAPERAAR